MKIVIAVLLGFSLMTTGCAGCDDAAGEPIDDSTDMAFPDLNSIVDLSLDSQTDLIADADDLDISSDSDVVEDLGFDMEEDLPVGPRPFLEFLGVNVIEEGRIGSLAVADDGNGGWYTAVASAGRDLIFEPGAGEEIIDTSGLNRFRSVFAHFGQNGELLATHAFTEYAGGPLPGGTSQTQDIAMEASGQVLVAGEFGGSVRFGNTVWSTPQGNVGGAIATSYETYVVRIDPQTLGVSAIVRLNSPSPGFTNSASSIAAHDNGDFTIAGYFSSSVTFPGGTVLTAPSGVAGYMARFTSSGTLIWATAVGLSAHMQKVEDSVLVRFSYGASFELGGVTYAAPAEGERGFALARIDADGSAGWIVRMEGPGFGYMHAYTPGPEGKIYVGARLENARFVDIVDPPAFTQPSAILVVEAATGALELLSPERISQSDSEEIRMIALDDAGVLWALISFENELALQVRPRFGAVLDVGAGDVNLMLGYNTSDGTLLYAHLAATTDILSSTLMTWLPTSAQILLGGHYFYDLTLEPMSMTPSVLSNSTPGTQPDTLFIRYR